MTTVTKHSTLTLHDSIKTLNLALVQQAFQRDSSTLNELDSTIGWSVLYKAVVYEQIEIAQYLIENGADPNVCNKIGESPLHYAAEIGRADFTELLLTHGADPNLKQTDGNTAFHIACKKNRTEIIKLMLNYNLDINAQNKLGTTPLHFAGNNRNTEVYQLFIERNADPTIKDRWGKKPVSLTASNNPQERRREPSANRTEKPVSNKPEEKRREPSVNRTEKPAEQKPANPSAMPHKAEGKAREPSVNRTEKPAEPKKSTPLPAPLSIPQRAEEKPQENTNRALEKSAEQKESSILKEICKMKESHEKENALRNKGQTQNFQKRLEMMKQRLNKPKEEPVTPTSFENMPEKHVIKQKNFNENRVLGDITNTFESSTPRCPEVSQSIDLYHARLNSHRFNQESTTPTANETIRSLISEKSKGVSASLSSLKLKENFPVVSPFQPESFAPPVVKKKIPSESQPQPKIPEVETLKDIDKENVEPTNQNRTKPKEKSLENDYLATIFGGKNRSLAQFSDSLSNNTNCTQGADSDNSSDLQLAEQLEQPSSEKSKPESDRQTTPSNKLTFVPSFSTKSLSTEKKLEETQSIKLPTTPKIQSHVPSFSTKISDFNKRSEEVESNNKQSTPSNFLAYAAKMSEMEKKLDSIESNKQFAPPKVQPCRMFDIEKKAEGIENKVQPTPPKIQPNVPNFSFANKISDFDTKSEEVESIIKPSTPSNFLTYAAKMSEPEKKPEETEHKKHSIASKSLSYVPNFSAKILEIEKKAEEIEMTKQPVHSKVQSNKIFSTEKKLEETTETKRQPTPSKIFGTEKKIEEILSPKLPVPSRTQPLTQISSLKIFDMEKKSEEKPAQMAQTISHRPHTQSLQNLQNYLSKPEVVSETPRTSEVPSLNKKILNIFCQKSAGADQAQKNQNLEKELMTIDWLKDIRLEELISNFTDNGYHYQDRFRRDYEKSKIIFQNLISRFGIDKYGHRCRVTMKLREDSGLFARKGLFVKKPNFKYPTVAEWLTSIGYAEYVESFLDNGFDDMEYLILQTSFKELPFDEFLMRDDLNIDDESVSDDILAKLRHVYETASQMEPYRYEAKRILDLLKNKK